jgi:hypothetical protein
MNPDVAFRGTCPTLAPNLMEFLRKFPFVACAVRVQVQSVTPVNFSGLGIDLQPGFLSDREPLLIFSLLTRSLLLDWNVGA